MSDFDEWWAKVDWTKGTFDTAKATWNHQQQTIDRKNERILMLQQRVEALEEQCDDSDRELVQALKRVEALEKAARAVVDEGVYASPYDRMQRLDALASLLQEGE